MVEPGKPVTVDADQGEPGTVPDLWPNEADDRKLWIFFNDWAGFGMILVGNIKLALTGDAER